MKKALVIVDMQMYLQARLDGGRDHINGNAMEKIVAMASVFRDNDETVIHIHHSDPDPASPMYAGAPAQLLMPGAEPLYGEPVFVKSTSSPFASTNLESYLRDNGIGTLFVTGAVAGYCVNTTVRTGADLGFTMVVVRDAVMGFDLPDENLSARMIFDVTMAHLKSDFADVVESQEIIASISE